MLAVHQAVQIHQVVLKILLVITARMQWKEQHTRRYIEIVKAQTTNCTCTTFYVPSQVVSLSWYSHSNSLPKCALVTTDELHQVGNVTMKKGKIFSVDKLNIRMVSFLQLLFRRKAHCGNERDMNTSMTFSINCEGNRLCQLQILVQNLLLLYIHGALRV